MLETPRRPRVRRSARPAVVGTVTAVVLALLSCLLAAGPVGAAPAASRDRAAFGVVPARGSHVDERAFFSYSLSPGSTAFDRVALVNYGIEPLTLKVAALDALNSDTGAYALQPTSARRADLGAWITIGDRDGSVVVPGRTATSAAGITVVPVTITVPADASPGDHGAGIVAILTTEGRNPQGQNINLEQRVAARVYVDVDGPAKPALAVSELSARYTGSWLPWSRGDVDVDYAVVNSGNVRLGVGSSVTTSGPLGVGERTATAESADELLPHNEQRQSVTIDSVWPLLRTRVTITATPKAAMGAPMPALDPVERSVTLWTVPLSFPILILILILAVALVAWRHKHRPAPGVHSTRARRGAASPSAPRAAETVGAGR